MSVTGCLPLPWCWPRSRIWTGYALRPGHDAQPLPEQSADGVCFSRRFTIAYAFFEVPTGAWGDRIGTRLLLTRIVVWWSSFTMVTAAAFSFTSLIVVRFLFGAGEAGAFPNVSKTFSRWFPVSERGAARAFSSRRPSGGRADSASGGGPAPMSCPGE